GGVTGGSVVKGVRGGSDVGAGGTVSLTSSIFGSGVEGVATDSGVWGGVGIEGAEGVGGTGGVTGSVTEVGFADVPDKAASTSDCGSEIVAVVGSGIAPPSKHK
ncbi:MAG: hypothetical protein ABII21_02050, partial [bacterium]